MSISIYNDGTFRDEIFPIYVHGIIIYFKIFRVLSPKVIVLTFTK